VRKVGYITLREVVAMNRDTQLDIRLETFVAYILSGTVFEITETGRMPIDDVELYCDSCGSPDGHSYVHTDANGFYSLAWTMNGVHPLFVRKPGYEIFDPDHTLRDAFGRIDATVNGDTRFDIRLEKKQLNTRPIADLHITQTRYAHVHTAISRRRRDRYRPCRVDRDGNDAHSAARAGAG
jgi:hypothetical protein